MKRRARGKTTTFSSAPRPHHASVYQNTACMSLPAVWARCDRCHLHRLLGYSPQLCPRWPWPAASPDSDAEGSAAVSLIADYGQHRQLINIKTLAPERVIGTTKWHSDASALEHHGWESSGRSHRPSARNVGYRSSLMASDSRKW